MALADDVARMEKAAAAFGDGKRLGGVLPVDALGHRVYLCVYWVGDDDEGVAWLVLDPDVEPVVNRQLVREAASLASLCEIAEDHLIEVELPQAKARLAEAPNEEAEAAFKAVLELFPPEVHVGSGARLDVLGAAAQRLEHALGEGAVTPFSAALQSAFGSVAAFADDVERSYPLPLA